MVKMNQACSKNIGQVIYTLFLLTLLESLVSGLIVFSGIKIFSDAAGTSAEIQSKIIFFALIFVAITVWLTFQFGFAIMLLRMTRNEKTNLGFLFMGFRKFNPAGKVILSLAAIISAAAVAARFIAKAIFSKVFPLFKDFFGGIASGMAEAAEQAAAQAANSAAEAASSISAAADATNAVSSGILDSAGAAASITPLSAEETLEIIFQAASFSLFFFLIAFVVVIHFAFVFHLHFDNPSWKVSKIFSQSFKMMKGKVFKLIGFALRAGGKNLLVAIVFAVLATFLPGEKAGLSILVFIFDLAYFINLYTALVKFYFTVPVLYEAILHEDLNGEIHPTLKIPLEIRNDNADSN